MDRVVVLRGGDSRESEISLMSGKAVEKALKKRGYDIISLDPSAKSFFKRLLSLRPTFVFIALHGGKGEDGSIQGFLEVLGIPYTGSGPLASALAMNKAFSKKLFISASLPTPEFVLLTKLQESYFSVSSLREKSYAGVKNRSGHGVRKDERRFLPRADFHAGEIKRPAEHFSEQSHFLYPIFIFFINPW